MDTTGCITNEVWLDYASGRLSQADNARVLRHAASCEICADILEGIHAMKQPETLPQRIEEINQKVQKHAVPVMPGRKISLWYIGVAAALLMASGLGWYILRVPAHDRVALKEKQQDTKQESLQEEVVKPADPEQKGEQVQSEKMKPQTGRKAPVAAQTIQDNDHLVAEEEFLTEEASGKTGDMKPVAPAIHEEQKISAIRAITGKEIQETTTAARKALTADESSALYQKQLTLDGARPVHADSLRYEKGVVFYANSSYDSCRHVLQPLLNNTQGLYYEDALLLAAKSYLAEGDKHNAIAYLEKVMRLNGKRTGEARQLLNELQ